jgi:hypothetical protein
MCDVSDEANVNEGANPKALETEYDRISVV